MRGLAALRVNILRGVMCPGGVLSLITDPGGGGVGRSRQKTRRSSPGGRGRRAMDALLGKPSRDDLLTDIITIPSKFETLVPSKGQ